MTTIFSFDTINKTVNQYHLPVFICNIDLTVVSVNDFIVNNDINICTGCHINDIFPSNAVDTYIATSNITRGLPYFSTNFDYNLHNTTIFMLPVIENGTTQASICMLIFKQDEALPLYMGLAPRIISDRFRSPTSDIMNMTTILARRLQDAEDYRGLEYINRITHCCYQMMGTSRAVQEYHALVNATKEFNFKKLIVNKFLEDICRTIQVLFSNGNFKLLFDDQTEKTIVTEFDVDMLSLAMFHIIANSCKFSPDGSTVKITLTAQNDSVNIIISDEGIGISKAVIAMVFDPFFCVNSEPVTEDNVGLGLGLPIVKKIVEAHHGKIFITSEPNHGTTITMHLPIILNNDTSLTLNSNAAKYMTDKFSNIYSIFANIFDIKFY